MDTSIWYNSGYKMSVHQHGTTFSIGVQDFRRQSFVQMTDVIHDLIQFSYTMILSMFMRYMLQLRQGVRIHLHMYMSYTVADTTCLSTLSTCHGTIHLGSIQGPWALPWVREKYSAWATAAESTDREVVYLISTMMMMMIMIMTIVNCKCGAPSGLGRTCLII